MNNDYGVFKEQTNPVEWMVQETPLVLGSEDQAINNLSYADAITISEYLSQGGEASFAPGRPVRKPNS